MFHMHDREEDETVARIQSDASAAEIARLREALSSARINLDLEGEEHTNTKEALSSETAAREKAERERDAERADAGKWFTEYMRLASNSPDGSTRPAIADLTRKLEAADVALEPFSIAAEFFPHGKDDSDVCVRQATSGRHYTDMFKLRDFRRAREARAALSPDPSGCALKTEEDGHG